MMFKYWLLLGKLGELRNLDQPWRKVLLATTIPMLKGYNLQPILKVTVQSFPSRH